MWDAVIRSHHIALVLILHSLHDTALIVDTSSIARYSINCFDTSLIARYCIDFYTSLIALYCIAIEKLHHILNNNAMLYSSSYVDVHLFDVTLHCIDS